MAKTMKDLNVTINKDEQTKKFAEHFATKQSVKNLIRVIEDDENFKGHAKVLDEAMNGGLGSAVLRIEGASDFFVNITANAMAKFSAQNAEWRNSGNTKSLPVRVEFLADTFCDMIKADSNKETYTNIINGMKDLAEVKALFDNLSKDGVSADHMDELIIETAAFSVLRETINRGVNFVEVEVVDVEVVDVDGDVIKSSAAHKSEKKDSGDAPKTEKSDSTAIIIRDDVDKEELFEQLKKIFTENPNDEVLEGIGDQLKKFTKKNFKEFVEMFTATAGNAKDENAANVKFHTRVLSVLFPHKTSNDSNISKLVNYFAVVMQDINPNDLETKKYDEIVVGYTMSAITIYSIVGAMSDSGKDVVDFYRTVMAYNDGDKNSDLFIKNIDNFTEKMDRINESIKVDSELGNNYAIDRAAYRRSRCFIRDGIKFIKEEAKKAA